MELVALLIYVAIGVVAGFLGGLLGIGGGLVAVPSLLAAFQALGLSMEDVMQVAIGTSLAAMVFTSASSAGAHYSQKSVCWPAFRILAPGVILGSILGAVIAIHLPKRGLELIFGFCEGAIGIYFLYPASVPENEMGLRSIYPAIFAAIGVGIGGISTLLGIGGGIVTVPILTAYGMPLRNAISTSAAIGFLIAISGAAAFLYPALEKHDFSVRTGYIYLPAFICIGLAASLIAPFGARLAHTLPIRSLQMVFGVVLIITGIWMIFPWRP